MDKKINDHDKSIADAKKVVFRYLKYRPRSEQEIIDKLKTKDFSGNVIQETVCYFQKIGSINDEQFARGWTRSRLNKPVGIRQIRMELKNKGISEDLIQGAVNEAMDDYEEYAAILQLAQRRLTKYQHLDRQKRKRRLYEFLCRRGFNSGAIFKALNGIFKPEIRNSKEI